MDCGHLDTFFFSASSSLLVRILISEKGHIYWMSGSFKTDIFNWSYKGQKIPFHPIRPLSKSFKCKLTLNLTLGLVPAEISFSSLIKSDPLLSLTAGFRSEVRFAIYYYLKDCVTYRAQQLTLRFEDALNLIYWR